MKKKCSRQIAVVIFIITMFALGGCKWVEKVASGGFNVSGYVKAVLDATYKGEYKDYLKLTKATKESAEKGYEDFISKEADYMAAYYKVEPVSADTKAKFTTLIKAIFKKAQYEVNEKPTEAKAQYNVEILISPIQIVKEAEAEVDAFVAAFVDRNNKGEFVSLTDEQFMDTYAAGIVDLLNNHLANTVAGEVQAINIKVDKNENKLYSINSKDHAMINDIILKYTE